ncbi:hypothetical protein KM043_016908 [Ampulex compressa]|nr:hypothetical protein KM043_016908 [Ampulex compressa]
MQYQHTYEGEYFLRPTGESNLNNTTNSCDSLLPNATYLYCVDLSAGTETPSQMLRRKDCCGSLVQKSTNFITLAVGCTNGCHSCCQEHVPRAGCAVVVDNTFSGSKTKLRGNVDRRVLLFLCLSDRKSVLSIQHPVVAHVTLVTGCLCRGLAVEACLQLSDLGLSVPGAHTAEHWTSV